MQTTDKALKANNVTTTLRGTYSRIPMTISVDNETVFAVSGDEALALVIEDLVTVWPRNRSEK